MLKPMLICWFYSFMLLPIKAPEGDFSSYVADCGMCLYKTPLRPQADSSPVLSSRTLAVKTQLSVRPSSLFGVHRSLAVQHAEVRGASKVPDG